MPKVTKSIDINSPVEKVFAYVSDPKNDPEWMVSMMEVSDVTGSGKGLRFHWKYKMAGIPFDGETVHTEYVPNERLVSESKGGIPSTFVFTFAPQKSGTKLGLEVDYKVPVPVLGKLAEKLVLKRNEREADMWMQNIKERLET